MAVEYSLDLSVEVEFLLYGVQERFLKKHGRYRGGTRFWASGVAR